jgi:hypothetical protein
MIKNNWNPKVIALIDNKNNNYLARKPKGYM